MPSPRLAGILLHALAAAVLALLLSSCARQRDEVLLRPQEPDSRPAEPADRR